MNQVLILSYNRPNMLREAIQSVLNSTNQDFMIHIVDDGSDFERFYPDSRMIWHCKPKLDGKERIGRVVDNINDVLATLDPKDIVFYLCDDDLMPVEWMERASFEFRKRHMAMHMIIGELWFFKSIRDAWKDNPETYKDWKWTTGTMAHRAYCFSNEGIRWEMNRYGHSFDIKFNDDMLKAHPMFMAISQPALYKRVHDKTVGNLFVGEEPPIIDGVME